MAQHQVLSEPPTAESGAAENGPASSDAGYSVGWPDAARIALVAVSVVAVRFHLWEPLEQLSLIGMLGFIALRLADL
jgi:hypothetical protein